MGHPHQVTSFTFTEGGHHWRAPLVQRFQPDCLKALDIHRSRVKKVLGLLLNNDCLVGIPIASIAIIPNIQLVAYTCDLVYVVINSDIPIFDGQMG